MPNALIVDDDRATLEALTILVEKLGFTTSTAMTWSDARSELLGSALDVVILDVFLPGGSGIDLLMEVPQEERPQVVLVSGDESIGKAFAALPMQELHFVPKPIDRDQLERTLGKVRRRCGQRVARHAAPEVGTARLLGDSPAMRRVRELIAKVAPLDFSVYIEGESGTGKELVAQATHEMSPRRGKPFVALNCGALPENLIDAELFGHAKGAFTGANSSREGVFQQADGGTLFLDEIAEMPVDLQVRLLRTLESGRVRPVGATKETEVDVRIVSATNRRFDQAIEDGRFREDLFHRLCVFPIVTPPLRDRPEDIAVLAERFCADLERDFGLSRRLLPETLAKLRAYSWPGNVRQLRNALQRAFVMAESEITPDCLPAPVVDAAAAGSGSMRAAGSRSQSDSDEVIRVDVGTTIASAERRLIEATLEHSSGDKRLAAEVLGVSLRTLYNRLKEYDETEAHGVT